MRLEKIRKDKIGKEKKRKENRTQQRVRNKTCYDFEGRPQQW